MSFTEELYGRIHDIIALGDTTLENGTEIAKDLDSAVMMDDVLIQLATLRYELRSNTDLLAFISNTPERRDLVLQNLEQIIHLVGNLERDFFAK